MLIAVSALVFLLMYLAPGDFLSEARNSPDVSQEIVKQEEMRLGLDKPWYMQYAMWLNSISPIKTKYLLSDDEKPKHSPIYLGFPDFGYSWSYKISVSSLLKQRLVPTLALAFSSLLLTYLIGIPLGALAAMKKDSIFDKVSGFLAYISLSVPYFFLALLAVLFAAISGILPTGGQTSIEYDFLPAPAKAWDFLKHLILPTIVLALGGIASLMRVMRGNFLDYSKQEYVITARAKGLSETKIALKHILRNAINPIITSFGFALSGVLSGALLIENVMNYPGLGQLLYSAILKQDQFVVMAGVVIACIMLVLGQLIADILLAVADPRIRLENEKVPVKVVSIILALVFSLGISLTLISEYFQGLWAVTLIIAKWVAIVALSLFVLCIILGLVWAVIFFAKNFLRQIFNSKKGAIAFSVLAIMYLLALLSQFVSPYSPSEQNLTKAFCPPTKVILKWDGFYVYQYERTDPSGANYEIIADDLAKIEFFKRASSYKFLGLINTNIHLFGTADDSKRIFLLGTDSTGRCVFSRLLYGSVISLSIGFIGIAITMVLGFLVGGLSGYFGGSFDFVSQRILEFLMAVPSLYLLLAMRSALAPHFDSGQMYAMIVIILSVLGWAGAARVIRGMSLSLRKRQFVLAAESMGQKPVTIIIKHFLPNMLSYLIVSAMLSIPAYILGEAALSFLGLGIQEPSASWGLMLAQAQGDTKVLMMGFWWLLIPGAAIFLTVLAFSVLGDTLRDIADPKSSNR